MVARLSARACFFCAARADVSVTAAAAAAVFKKFLHNSQTILASAHFVAQQWRL
jgi:hypothetical protein